MNYFSMKNENHDSSTGNGLNASGGSTIHSKSVNTSAMIFTNMDGRVTYINPEAQRITGWSMKDAVKTNCNEVFRIYDLESNSIIDDPVETVIESDSKIDLTVNICLENRDGLKYEIEFKASPKYSDDGQMNRIILTFREIRELENIAVTDVSENDRFDESQDPTGESLSVSELSFNDIDEGDDSQFVDNQITVDKPVEVKDVGEEQSELEIINYPEDKKNKKEEEVYSISLDEVEEPDFMTG